MTDRIKENYTESIQTKIAAAEALPDAIHTAAQMITICLLNGHKVLACGNGPSAALAQLFISELVNCYETPAPFPARHGADCRYGHHQCHRHRSRF